MCVCLSFANYLNMALGPVIPRHTYIQIQFLVFLVGDDDAVQLPRAAAGAGPNVTEHCRGIAVVKSNGLTHTHTKVTNTHTRSFRLQ